MKHFTIEGLMRREFVPGRAPKPFPGCPTRIAWYVRMQPGTGLVSVPHPLLGRYIGKPRHMRPVPTGPGWYHEYFLCEFDQANLVTVVSTIPGSRTCGRGVLTNGALTYYYRPRTASTHGFWWWIRAWGVFPVAGHQVYESVVGDRLSLYQDWVANCQRTGRWNG